MPTKIGPNKSNFYGGIIFQILAIGIISYCIFVLNAINWSFNSDYRTIRLWILLGGLLFWAIRYAPALYTTPYWVIVDDDTKTLELKYFLKKPRLIRRDHMVSYADTTISVNTRSGTTTYAGLYIHLNDNAKVLLSERSLEDCSYIKSMLDYWGIKKPEAEEQYSA